MLFSFVFFNGSLSRLNRFRSQPQIADLGTAVFGTSMLA